MGTARAAAYGGGGSDGNCVVLELPLEKAADTFNLEKAVCSHGLFMMAPNYWDPLSKTLVRPLRLDSDDDSGNEASVLSSTPTSLLVRICHPADSPHSLHLRVLGIGSLSPQHQQNLLDQVRRMLRLSEPEEVIVREFQGMHRVAKERGFGRVFRSPTLFEDMVKCILFCNCQWSRTLSMARALCELQFDLQCPRSTFPIAKVDDGTSSNRSTSEPEQFIPKTPSGKESKRRLGARKRSINLASRFQETNAHIEAENVTKGDPVEMSDGLQGRKLIIEKNFHYSCDSCRAPTEICVTNLTKTEKTDSCLCSDLQSPDSEGKEFFSHNGIGNFPSPCELANLNENFLAKRCNLGYRASRILKLAQSIVAGRIQLRQLEEAYREPSLLNYSKLAEQLQEINGFGPFTCANVLMCMGFYHVIPTDSETIRHLKQVHARDSTIQRVKMDVEAIYGKYAPFQFLAYWLEVWHFYEEWFGKLSEMPHADYKLITAANMRPTKGGQFKRTKMSR